MKVGLLTLPLLYNYGAILQAYALYHKINELGGECTLLDVDLPIYPYYRRPLSVVSRLFSKFIKHRDIEIFPYWMSKRTEKIISSKTRPFVEKMIPNRTHLIKKFSSDYDKFDVYIVGSDQVWRRSLGLSVENYLFDFVERDKRKCSYAASFGVDYWEYSPKVTSKIRRLMSQFRCITVREDSAVSLIQKKLGLEATHVLDPTLLLDRTEYINLIKNNENDKDNHFIFTYILDLDRWKTNIVSQIEDTLELPSIDILPRTKLGYFTSAENNIYPEVEKWLSDMAKCDAVVTDSFHGTVFSIIFNKPFCVLRNDCRGNTRLDSLLKMFHLQERVAESAIDARKVVRTNIDWDKVNYILETEREKSLNMLHLMIK